MPQISAILLQRGSKDPRECFFVARFLVSAGMPIIFANAHTKIYYNCFIPQGITHSDKFSVLMVLQYWYLNISSHIWILGKENIALITLFVMAHLTIVYASVTISTSKTANGEGNLLLELSNLRNGNLFQIMNNSVVLT